jgi:L-lactate dehydrogenase (cytochrome)
MIKMTTDFYHPQYTDLEYLRKKAKSKMPGFAFDYLVGGCNEDVNLVKNTVKLREVELIPNYINDNAKIPDLSINLFGKLFNAPFGIAPVGLQGLMWPNAPQILASAAYKHNIPFILSTVSTASLEQVAEITQGNAWYQLYHPADSTITEDILKRLASSGYEVLVLLADVPSFGFRPRDIKNGLALPPKMSLRNILQIFTRPEWALKTLYYGQPEFKTMKPYMPKGLNLKQLGAYMNKTFDGKLNEEKIKRIRDLWKGKLVLKGVASEQDASLAVKYGFDGIIVSNHGGRQLDAGEASISSLQKLIPKYKQYLTVMMDSGVQSGVDVGRTLACGADAVFLGRTFMYSVAALGNKGGHHAINIIKAQLLQLMQQLGANKVNNLQDTLI